MQSYGMDDWESWKGFIEPHACLMEHRTGNMYASKAHAHSKYIAGSAPLVKHRTILTFMCMKFSLCVQAGPLGTDYVYAA